MKRSSGPGSADVAGVKHFLQAAEDAGFGVGEGSVEVEDEGGQG